MSFTYKFTDECGGECFVNNCKGKLYRLVREGLHIFPLSEGRFVEVENYNSWCCEECGEECFDAEQCEIKEKAIEKKYPTYFRKFGTKGTPI